MMRLTPDNRDNRELTSFLGSLGGSLPLVAHSIGQSIGSTGHFDRQHLSQIRRWQERFGSPGSSRRCDAIDGARLEIVARKPGAYDPPPLISV
jgi:hypothetical protein